MRNNSGSQFGKAAWLLAAMIGLAVSGCDGSIFSRKSDEDVSGVELRTVTAAELEQVIQGQKGRVVLVDFWATWCGPCCQLFPHNVALQKQFADQGLTVVTVSVDGVANEAEVKRFLKRSDGKTLNFLASDEFQDYPFKTAGGIPFIQIYDRQGKLHPPIVGRDEAAIDSTVKTLLAEM